MGLRDDQDKEYSRHDKTKGISKIDESERVEGNEIEETVDVEKNRDLKRLMRCKGIGQTNNTEKK